MTYLAETLTATNNENPFSSFAIVRKFLYYKASPNN